MLAIMLAIMLAELGGQQHALPRHARMLAHRGGVAVSGGGSGGSGGGGSSGGSGGGGGGGGRSSGGGGGGGCGGGGGGGGRRLAMLAAVLISVLSPLGLPRGGIPLNDTPRPRALQPQLRRLQQRATPRRLALRPAAAVRRHVLQVGARRRQVGTPPLRLLKG